MTPKATFRELSVNVNFPDAFSVKGLLCHAAGWYVCMVGVAGEQNCGAPKPVWLMVAVSIMRESPSLKLCMIGGKSCHPTFIPNFFEISQDRKATIP